MTQRRRVTQYQYEPLVAPQKWGADEQRFSLQLSRIIDDLYQKIGVTRSAIGSATNPNNAGKLVLIGENGELSTVLLGDEFIIVNGAIRVKSELSSVLLVVDKHGAAVLSGAEIVVDSEGYATIVGADLTVGNDGSGQIS